MDEPAAAFWDWSLAAYDRPGAAPAALRLQDELGLDVNICLWAAWCAIHFEPLREIHLRKAIDITADWRREVVEPLRNARRFLKDKTEIAGALREAIKRDELAAEKLEQESLATLAGAHLARAPAPDPASTARRNLAAYAALTGASKQRGFTVSLLESFLEPIVVSEPEQKSREKQ